MFPSICPRVRLVVVLLLLGCSAAVLAQSRGRGARPAAGTPTVGRGAFAQVVPSTPIKIEVGAQLPADPGSHFNDYTYTVVATGEPYVLDGVSVSETTSYVLSRNGDIILAARNAAGEAVLFKNGKRLALADKFVSIEGLQANDSATYAYFGVVSLTPRKRMLVVNDAVIAADGADYRGFPINAVIAAALSNTGTVLFTATRQPPNGAQPDPHASLFRARSETSCSADHSVIC